MKQTIKVGSTLVHIEYSSMSEQDAKVGDLVKVNIVIGGEVFTSARLHGEHGIIVSCYVHDDGTILPVVQFTSGEKKIFNPSDLIAVSTLWRDV